MYHRYYDEVINYLENGTYWTGATDSEKAIIQKRASKYKVLNGVLYHKGKGRGIEDLRFVPITLADQMNAIRICHTNAENDEHYGINKTTSLLASKFYWRMMFTDVIKFIKKCPICKELNNVQWNFLQEDEKEKANTWKLVEIDILENFHSTRKNIYHVVRMVDVFSNWTSYVPLTDLNEKSIIKGIMKEFSTIGFPLSFRFVNLKVPGAVLKALQTELVNFSVVHSNNDNSIDYTVHVTMEDSYENGQPKPSCEEYLSQYQDVLDKHKASLYVFFGMFSIAVPQIQSFYAKKLEEFCKEYPYTWTNKLHYLLFSVQNLTSPEMKRSPHAIVFGRSGGLFHPEPSLDQFYDSELIADSFFNLEHVTRKKIKSVNDVSGSPESLREETEISSTSQGVPLKQTKAKKRKASPKGDESENDWPKLTEDEDKILEELFPGDERTLPKKITKKGKGDGSRLKSSLAKKPITPSENPKSRKRSVSFLPEDHSSSIASVTSTINNLPPYYGATTATNLYTPIKDPFAQFVPPVSNLLTTSVPAKEESSPGRYSFRQNLKAKGPSSFVHRFIAISTSKRGTNRIELESPETPPTPVRRKPKNKLPPYSHTPLKYPVFNHLNSSIPPRDTGSSSLLLKEALTELAATQQTSGITPLPALNEEVNTNQTDVLTLLDKSVNKTSLILNSELIVPNTDQQALNNVLKGDLFSNAISTSVSESSSLFKVNNAVAEEQIEVLDKEQDSELSIELANNAANVERMKFNILADDLQLSDEDSLIEKVSMDIDLTPEVNPTEPQRENQKMEIVDDSEISLSTSLSKVLREECEVKTNLVDELLGHDKEGLNETPVVEAFVTSENVSGEIILNSAPEMYVEIEDAMCVVGECEIAEEDEEDKIVLENKPEYQDFVDKSSLIEDSVSNQNSIVEPASVERNENKVPLTQENQIAVAASKNDVEQLGAKPEAANEVTVFATACFNENSTANADVPKTLMDDVFNQFEIVPPEELKDGSLSPNFEKEVSDNNFVRTNSDYAEEFGLKECSVKLDALPLDLVRQGMAQSVYLRTIVYNNRKSYYFGSNKLFDMKYEPRVREPKRLPNPTVVIGVKDLLPDNLSISYKTCVENKKQIKAKAPVPETEEKSNKCPVCPKTVLPNEDMLNLHLKFHCASEVRNIICPICQKPGSSWQALLRHYSNHEEGRLELKRINIEVPNNSLCPICRKICPNKDDLAKHMQLKHPSNETGVTFKCDKCDQQFRDQKTLRKHSEKHLNQNFTCDDCGYSTKVHYNYLMHRDHECQLANRGMETIKNETVEIDFSNLKLAVPTPEKLEEQVKSKPPVNKTPKHSCEFCPLKFKSVSLLNAHMPSHDDLLSFSCKICDYKSKHKSVIVRHAKRAHVEFPTKQIIKQPKKQLQFTRRNSKKMESEDEVDTDGLDGKNNGAEENTDIKQEDGDDGIPTATLVISQDEYGEIVVCDADNNAELAIDATVPEEPATLVIEESGLTLDSNVALHLLQGNDAMVEGTDAKVLYVSMSSDSFQALDNSAFTIIDNDR